MSTTLVPVMTDSPINIEELRWMLVIIGYFQKQVEMLRRCVQELT